MKNKVRTLIIIGVIAIGLGVAYGFFNYFVLSKNSQLISGDIYLNFNQSNDLTMTKAFPEMTSDAREKDDNYITFTITGKNTFTTDFFYKIMLNDGEEKKGFERLKAKDLRFDLVEINENNQERMVVSDMSFASFDETVIYSSSVAAETNNNITRTYKLRMWVDDRVLISDTDPQADYAATGEHAYKNHYASIKVSVKAETGTLKGYVKYNVDGEIQKQPIYEEMKTTIRQVSAETGKINYGWSTSPNGELVYKSNAEVELNSDVTLYPIYINENVMSYFPTFVTSNKASIKEVFFNKSTTESLARYEAASSSLKGDITTIGHVYTWLEQDPEDSLYRLYVESDSITFLTECANLFSDFSVLKSINFNNIDTFRVITMASMFGSCDDLTNLDLSSFDTRNVTNMEWMFSRCSSLTSLDLSHFDTRRVTLMNAMFAYCDDLASLNLNGFNTSNVVNMEWMFSNCGSLTSLNLSHFNTNNVTNMEWMFSRCANLTSLNLSHFDTSRVTTMEAMFSYCSGLTSLNLNGIDVRNVLSMAYMFSGCTNLASLDLSSLNTKNVTNMEWMFSGCSSLANLDLNFIDTKRVTTMDAMFAYCSSLTSLDLSSFDTQKVASVSSMFSGCANLEKIYVSNLWTLGENITSNTSIGMFNSCSNLEGENGTTIASTGNIVDATYAKVDEVGSPGYFWLKDA